MSIYIDVPDDIRILRRLQRDVAERGRTVPSVISQYLETVRPMHQQHVAPTKSQADVVVDWVQRDEDKVKQLAERIMCMVKDAP